MSNGAKDSMDELWSVFENADDAMRRARTFVGLDPDCETDALECLALGVVARLMGGVVDPEPWGDSCLITPEGRTVKVSLIECDALAVAPTAGAVFGVELFADLEAQAEDANEDDLTFAFVAVAGRQLLAVHLVDDPDVNGAAEGLGRDMAGEGLPGGYAIDVWFHENVKMEPLIAQALGVRTRWFDDRPYAAAAWPD